MFKHMILATLLVGATAQQPWTPTVPPNTPSSAQPRSTDDEPEQYPGQHDHAQPPEGWMCHQPPIDLSGDQTHWCSCERSCDEETQVVHEDEKCTTNCHSDHCKCPMGNAKRCMPAEQQ